MIVTAVVIAVVLAALAAGMLLGSVRVVRPDERGVVFRLGRAQSAVREPGTTMIIPAVDRLARVPMATRVADVPADELVTRGDVAVRVGAVVHVRVVDPVTAMVNVADPLAAVAQLTATSLRSFIGHCDLDELARSDHGEIDAQLRELVAEAAEESWGVRIERVEIVVPKMWSHRDLSAER